MAKSLVLSVSVETGCYRHIRIGESATLFTLSSTILSAFNFYDDHLHSFFMNNRAWDQDAEFVCPSSDLDGALGYTDKVRLSKFSLFKGAKFLYIFDYGDEWRFSIKVLRVIDEPTIRPEILKSVGRISQYGDDDDDDDYENDDDNGDDDDDVDDGTDDGGDGDDGNDGDDF
ncbi:MAG: plasmid pRiA4b ORF-3 family protein [Oscillospiraceae bacterium]|nr:plasmid pRiA4b ORF-3 family protein [Oscillospiraceae bacterium]